MNAETIIEALLTLFKNSNNMSFMLQAIVVCMLTQVMKKLIVNKIKTEILGKFNIATVLPFLLGTGMAVIDRVVSHSWQWSGACIYEVALSGVAVGALAVVMFRLISTISGGSIKSTMSSGTMGMIFHQLMYFGTVKSQLASGKLKLDDFVSQVKLIASNCDQIYSQDMDNDSKKTQLSLLLKGIIDVDNFYGVVETIHASLVTTCITTKKT